MEKVSIYQKNIMILNFYVPNNIKTYKAKVDRSNRNKQIYHSGKM